MEISEEDHISNLKFLNNIMKSKKITSDLFFGKLEDTNLYYIINRPRHSYDHIPLNTVEEIFKKSKIPYKKFKRTINMWSKIESISVDQNILTKIRKLNILLER